MKSVKKISLVTAFVAAAGFAAYNYSGDNDSKDPINTNSNTFLFLSDIHLDSHTQTTDYKDDTGMILWKAFLAKANDVISKSNPDFIIYTGDLPSHLENCCFLPPNSREPHNENIETILSGLRDLATKHKKTLLYLPGNNDGIAGDYASFADEQQKTPFSLIPENNNQYPALNINATGNKAPCMVSNPDPKMGYYSARPVEGLRVIALNTVIHSANFFAVDGTTQLADAKKQMTWFANELKDAKAKGEKAYVAMHIPPGIDAYGYQKHGDDATNWAKLPATNPWNNQFLEIVAKNQDLIAGILYGHTHMDELRRLYDASGKNITEIMISCPGVTPIHDNNPGFKTVSYDATSKELLDFTTYHTVPSATTWGDASYSFNSIFGYSSSKTMYENLKADSIDAIHTKLDSIYTVMHGAPGYNIEPGIEVVMEK